MRNAASFIASQNESAEAGLLHAVARFAHETLNAWKRRRQIAVLVDFDDHMLSDIGLSRRDVKDALDLPFSHDPGRELQLRASRNLSHGWNA
jgi:uncharacterized protein YjiS (DUF1127 family)